MQLNTKIFTDGLVKVACDNGGKVVPLTFNLPIEDGVAMMNPSILNINNKLYVNLRCTNYTLFHNENKELPHHYGYLTYVHPFRQRKLITTNYISELDSEFNLINPRKVHMDFDITPKWDFWGLEDARLINWDNKIYLCGVRRDTTDNGEGRMELSQIILGNDIKEVSRYRIPMPEGEESYCEKNWVPILDKPYHFIKWSNPTELVECDVINKITKSTKFDKANEFITGVRGGTQVISYKDYYVAIGHSFTYQTPDYGQKDGYYLANLVIWDKDFNLKYISDGFKFLNAKIEFQCGMCLYNDEFLITFSCSDNAAFLVSIKPEVLFNE